MKKIKIYLQRSDFDIDQGYLKNYCRPSDCPLARAIKRQLNAKDVNVDGANYHKPSDLEIDDEDYHFFNWNGHIADNVANAYLNGDKTQYYVEIEKI